MHLLRRLISPSLLFAATPLLAQDNPTAEDAAALAACGVCGGVMLLIPLSVLVVSIIIAVWMYRDSVRRGDSQAVLWAVIGLLFNVLGLVIYIIVRNREVPPPPPPV